jgi:hypothetical protein
MVPEGDAGSLPRCWSSRHGADCRRCAGDIRMHMAQKLITGISAAWAHAGGVPSR